MDEAVFSVFFLLFSFLFFQPILGVSFNGVSMSFGFSLCKGAYAADDAVQICSQYRC